MISLHVQDTDKCEAITVLVHGNTKQSHCVALIEAQKTHNDVLTLILPNEKVPNGARAACID